MEQRSYFQADGVVKDKLDTHRAGIDILGGGGDALASAIPASGAQAVKGSPAVTKLKALMEDVETIKAERQDNLVSVQDT